MDRNDFAKYLVEIGMSGTLIERVQEIYTFYKSVSPEELDDIFVTNIIKEDGSNEWTNLWFFTKTHMMEAKNFITHDNFDMVSYAGRIRRWELEKTKFDFEQAADASRLHMHFFFTPGHEGHLYAARKNCEYLVSIFRKYILSDFNTS